MTQPLDFGRSARPPAGTGRAGVVLGRTEYTDRLGSQYRVVVTSHHVLAAAELPQLGRDQLQRVTVTTALRDEDRDESGGLRYRIELFDQRLPFTWQMLASFRLRDADFERARDLVEALAAAVAADALDPNAAGFPDES